MTWRSERIRLEALFLVNATRKIDASEDFQNEFPAMAKYAAESMPWIQRTLIETVAKKHHKTVAELQNALLADTGATSLDEALRTPVGSFPSAFDMLWADSDATDDRLELAIRNWLRARQLPISRVRQMENVLFALAIVISISALVFMVVSLKGKFL